MSMGEAGVVLNTNMGDAGVVEAKCSDRPWTGVVVPVDVVVMGEPTEGAVLDVGCGCWVEEWG